MSAHFESPRWFNLQRRLRAVGLALDAVPQSTFGVVQFTAAQAGALAQALTEAGAGSALRGEGAVCSVTQALSFMRRFDGVATVALYADAGAIRANEGWLIASVDVTDDVDELEARIEQFISDVQLYVESSASPPPVESPSVTLDMEF